MQRARRGRAGGGSVAQPGALSHVPGHLRGNAGAFARVRQFSPAARTFRPSARLVSCHSSYETPKMRQGALGVYFPCCEREASIELTDFAVVAGAGDVAHPAQSPRAPAGTL